MESNECLALVERMRADGEVERKRGRGEDGKKMLTTLRIPPSGPRRARTWEREGAYLAFTAVDGAALADAAGDDERWQWMSGRWDGKCRMKEERGRERKSVK